MDGQKELNEQRFARETTVGGGAESLPSEV